MANQPICKFYMTTGCNKQNCKFIHNPLLCNLYWKEGKCTIIDCQLQHINNKKENNKKDNKNIKKKKNTECFEPLNRPVDLQLSIDLNHYNLNTNITDRELLLAPNVFSDFEQYEIYNNLINEIETCDININDLLKMWHGNDKLEGTHFICDDKLNWKNKCPTFNLVIERLTNYFNVDVQATRLNWYRDTNQWKPFHHDSAAVDPKKAKKQNITIAVSFGCTRNIALESGEDTKHTRKVISFKQNDGEIYAFANKTNELWRHGILKEHNYKNEGRISIIIWGKVNDLIIL